MITTGFMCLYKPLIKTGFMCLLDLLQLKGEEWDAVGVSCTLFGIAVRRSKCGKTG